MRNLPSRHPLVPSCRPHPRSFSPLQQHRWYAQYRERKTRGQDMQILKAHAGDPGGNGEEHDDREDVAGKDYAD